MKTFKEKVEHKRHLIKKHHDDLKKLLESCPHEELTHKTYYFSGSYLDKAYTDHWDECVCCGKRFNDYTDHHDYFG